MKIPEKFFVRRFNTICIYFFVAIRNLARYATKKNSNFDVTFRLNRPYIYVYIIQTLFSFLILFCQGNLSTCQGNGREFKKLNLVVSLIIIQNINQKYS